MYFDFEDQHPDIAPVGRAISWRVGVLVSLLLHVGAVLALLLGAPAAAARLIPFSPPAAVPENAPQEPTRFVFIAPRVDRRSSTPPLRAPFSDEDRTVATVERPPDPVNPLPFSRGDTSERVERQAAEMARGSGPGPAPVPEQQAAAPSAPPAPEVAITQRLPESQSARVEAPSTRPETPGRRAALPGGSLGDALRNLDRSAQPGQFDNQSGGNTRYGQFLQFDSKGVDFGRWLVRFKAQVERGWLIPQAAAFMSGHVAVTFNVYRNGRITDVRIAATSGVPAFDTAAFGAISSSNPTVPLPPEYPDDHVFFTATFYYNERPPY